MSNDAKNRGRSDRPNILFIFSDQHSPHIAGYAGDRHARTAALDALAAESTCFANAFCQAPLCTPSRICLLTGQYAHECGAFSNGSQLQDEHLTFAKHLSDNGYTTCLIGKMHLQGDNWMGGFDHRPYGDLRSRAFSFHQPDPPETCDGRWNRHSVGRFPWAGETQIPESMLVDHVATQETLAFLREHDDVQPDKPWMMTVGYNRPHFPLTAPGRYVRRALADKSPRPWIPQGYPDDIHPHDRNIVDDFHLLDFSEQEHERARACYYACVDYVDDCIGQLLDGLREDGLLDNTYVIYASDHGEMAYEHGLWWKRTYYDASAGVPLLISGPGLQQGKGCDIPVELIDLYPTFCEMAGIETPTQVRGESLMPLCRGDESSRVKRHARCDLYQGSGRNESMFRMVCDERYKYVNFAHLDFADVVFDRKADPGEQRDLNASDEPLSKVEKDAVDRLKACVSDYPDWDRIVEMREADGLRRKKAKEEKLSSDEAKNGKQLPPAAAQYMLKDGCIINADGELYQPRN